MEYRSYVYHTDLSSSPLFPTSTTPKLTTVANMSYPHESSISRRSLSAPELSTAAAVPAAESPITIEHINMLWLPTLTELTTLGEAVDDLDLQFDSFIVDPNRYSNNIGQQFRYKVSLNYWFHEAIPAAKLNLLRQLSYYWTATATGRAWIDLCTRQLGFLTESLVQIVRERTERAAKMIVEMQRRVDRKFTNMTQMVQLNPAWRNAEKDRFFGLRGPVVPIARDVTPVESDGEAA